MKILHLVLKFHWYDATDIGVKRVEFREMSERWKRIIWDKREEYTHVRFARGYTSTMMLFEIEKIDIGGCYLVGWNDDYYRIHFKKIEADSVQRAV